MDFSLSKDQEQLRDAIERVCEPFDADYWLRKDREGGFPEEFHRALADADLLWQLWQKLHAALPADLINSAMQTLLQRPSLPSNLPADVLDDMPDTPGVYLFYGENDLPLYVGKSVKLRQRVLSHFNADHKLYKDMRLSQQLHRIDWRETAGEIGALLLEAQLIKTHQPLFNIRLRRLRNTNSIRLSANGLGLTPEIVNSKDTAIGQTDGLYGLFSSQHAAQEKLRELAQGHALCHALLGLEKPSKRGCFGLQVKACQGACVGLEERSTHDQRLLKALLEMKIHAWPYAGAVDIVETDGDWTEKHRIHHWRYLGTWSSQTQTTRTHTQTAFDMDTYKILVKPIMLGTAQVLGVRS